MNARLIKSKENLISDELTNRKIDILIATETWLQDSKQDATWVSTYKLGSSSFQIFTKTEAAKEERALPSLKTKIIKYCNKKMCMLTPASSTTSGTHN